MWSSRLWWPSPCSPHRVAVPWPYHQQPQLASLATIGLIEISPLEQVSVLSLAKEKMEAMILAICRANDNEPGFVGVGVRVCAWFERNVIRSTLVSQS
mmetsp:Transcript_105652/g.264533  ORF Transcript_105652/g.264533 Transcript_105652/m.264533 type:complete len:98 (-) Transcript_105652:98-391(-)